MEAPGTAEVAALTGGRYAVSKLLATGGMGAVYLASHRELGSRVAIKVLPEVVALNSDHLARFKREAAIAARMSHPNVVPVFEYSADGAMPYLIMPFIDGRTLREVIDQDGPLDTVGVLKLIREIGGALAFAHGRDIVHRDVKPSNILLENETNRWLITDFGIARSDVPVEEEITRSGAAIGTPAYMAPEQFGAAGKVDQRADLYSLAVIAVEALTGTRCDPLATGAESVAWLKQTRPDLSDRTARALTGPLAHAPGDRPSNVAAWIESMEAALGRRRRNVVAGLVAAALTLAAFVLFSPDQLPQSARTTSVAVFPVTVTGTSPGIDLGTVLPLALQWHVQRLPGFRVLGADAVQDAQSRQFGSETPPLWRRLEVMRRIGATKAVEAWADVNGDSVQLRLVIHDTDRSTQSDTYMESSSLDNLDGLVSDLVVSSFAQSLAAEQSGVATPALPNGIEAIGEYVLGDRSFRHGDYQDAIRRFSRVMELDSTYALAPFKRMLAVTNSVRPIQASDELRSAVAAVQAYSDRLDPAYAGLLNGYRLLFTEGDLSAARDQIELVLDANPDLIDARFVLAYLQYRVGPLLGISLAEARRSFYAVVDRDPEFAAAEANLAMIAIAMDDRSDAQTHIERYLAIDSVSEWAELARAADSLVFRQTAAPAVIASLPSRSDRFLEIIALAGADPNPTGGARAVAESAAREMWRRARTDLEKERTFRILMAYYIGSARHETAQTFFRDAVELPRRERDRWLVLSRVADLPDLGNAADVPRAAARLAAAPDSAPETAQDIWLAARWYRQTSRDEYETAAGRLREPGTDGRPLGRSLALDLTAREALASGDTAAAFEAWEQALGRYAIDQIFVGLVASQWATRLDYARAALVSGNAELAFSLTTPFTAMVSVLDQLAWADVTGVRATAAVEMRRVNEAISAYRRMLRTVARPDGSGGIIREDLQRALDELGQPN